LIVDRQHHDGTLHRSHLLVLSGDLHKLQKQSAAHFAAMTFPWLTDYSIWQSILNHLEERMSFAQYRAALSQISETERRTPQQAR
jgi:hypothetical protein